MFGPDMTCPGTKVGCIHTCRFSTVQWKSDNVLPVLSSRFTSSSVTRTLSLVNSRRSISRLPPSPTSRSYGVCTLSLSSTFSLSLSVTQFDPYSHVSCCSPDNTYEILYNHDSLATGSLLEDFDPPVNPEAEIDDPEDFKPDTWVDAKKIADPEASKVPYVLLYDRS